MVDIEGEIWNKSLTYKRANKSAHDGCRKIVKPQDVFKALENVGLGSFVNQVQQDLESYEAYRNERKNKPENGVVAKSNADDISDDEETAANIDGPTSDVGGSKKAKVGDDRSDDEDVTMDEVGNETTEILEDDDQEEEDPTELRDETNDDTIEMEDTVDDLGNANNNESEDEDDDEETVNFRNK